MQPQEIKQKLERVFNEEQASVLTEVYVDAYSALVKAGDFNELKEIVRNIGIKVGELAEAQKRTETRVGELAEAQKQLAQAQGKTEVSLRELVLEHKETRRQLGGLSDTVGYTIENEAYKALPRLLEKNHGIKAEEKFYRRYVSVKNGREIEVNIFGKARRGKDEIIVAGEAKSQLSRNDVDRFVQKKLNPLKKVYKNIFCVLVTHMTSGSDVEAYAKEKGIEVYYSYLF